MIKRAPTPPTSLVPDLPPEVERVCARALAKERDARFASCGQLAAALRSAAVPVEPAGPPLALVAVGVALGALVAVVAGLGWALASGPAPASPAEERALAGAAPSRSPPRSDATGTCPLPGWSARWALTDPAPLAATPAEAWPSPTRVQPLAVRAPAALGELFDGVVTCLEEDRLAVDYDLPRALRVTSFLPPALALVLGPGDRVVGRPHGDGLRLLSPNDGSTVLALVGRSRWTRPAVRVGCVVERIDLSSFTIQLRPRGSR